MKRQRGYIDVGNVGLFYVIGLLAVLALIFVGLPALGWWLWENFDIVRAR